MTDTKDIVEQPDEWLLVKRGLYWRPNSHGYTGLRDEAGRYSHAEASRKCNEGVSMIHISEASEFCVTANPEVKVKHLLKQRAEQADTITSLRAEVERKSLAHNDLLVAIKFHSGEDHALMGLRKLVAERDAALARAEKAEAALDKARVAVRYGEPKMLAAALTEGE